MNLQKRIGIGSMTAKNLLFFCAVLAFCCSGDAPLWGVDEPSFPYQAFALRDGTLVRSGPGTAHYATDELRQGQPVEVWRHDPDGWCAIRPTPDSFSLIPAEAVEVLAVDRCRVVQSGLQAWVGTRLGPVENPLWQVKLNADEELVILGEVNWPSPEGSSLTWYQVAPPDGEFRWVQQKDLRVPDPRTELGAEKSSAGTYLDSRVQPTGQFEELERPLAFGPQRKASAPATAEGGIIIDPFGEEEATALGSQARSGDSTTGWRRARRPFRAAQSTPPLNGAAAYSPANGSSPGNAFPSGSAGMPAASVMPGQTSSEGGVSGSWAALDRPAGRDLNAAAGSAPVDFASTGSPVMPTPGTENLPARLRQIDVDLSMEIVKPAGQWQFSRLIQRLNEAYASAGSEAERNQSQQLIAKIDRLKELQFNLTGRKSLDEGRVAEKGDAAKIGNGIAANVEFGTTYDAYGWLSECVQDSGRTPSTFVLQDDNGKIICQVTPAPGFNMHRYLKTKVGVIGQRGFNQKLNLNHVLVDRVVVLENPTKNWR